MPARDGTGPVGYGPRTGRGMGYCVGSGATGYDVPGWAGPGPGRRFYGRGGRGGGRGLGRGGGGWGYRRQYYATRVPTVPPWAPYAAPSREQEVEMLRGEAEWLKEQMDAIKQRMDELSQE